MPASGLSDLVTFYVSPLALCQHCFPLSHGASAALASSVPWTGQHCCCLRTFIRAVPSWITLPTYTHLGDSTYYSGLVQVLNVCLLYPRSLFIILHFCCTFLLYEIIILLLVNHLSSPYNLSPMRAGSCLSLLLHVQHPASLLSTE